MQHAPNATPLLDAPRCRGRERAHLRGAGPLTPGTIGAHARRSARRPPRADHLAAPAARDRGARTTAPQKYLSADEALRFIIDLAIHKPRLRLLGAPATAARRSLRDGGPCLWRRARRPSVPDPSPAFVRARVCGVRKAPVSENNVRTPYVRRGPAGRSSRSGRALPVALACSGGWASATRPESLAVGRLRVPSAPRVLRAGEPRARPSRGHGEALTPRWRADAAPPASRAIVRCHSSRPGSGHRDVANPIVSSGTARREKQSSATPHPRGSPCPNGITRSVRIS